MAQEKPATPVAEASSNADTEAVNVEKGIGL